MSAPDRAMLPQYEALIHRAGVATLPDRSLIEVVGADRATFLHNFCTNDVKRLTAGTGCEAFFTNHQGKTIGHGFIFAQDDSLVIETTPGQAAPLIAHFDRFVISERVEFRDRSNEWQELFVGGSQAAKLLEAAAGRPAPDAMLSLAQATIASQSVMLRRVGFTKSPGWLVQCERAAVEAVRTALLEFGGEEIAPSALEMCRIEAAWPWFGVDITDANLPQEIDRNDAAISFKKGCYLGQETVARLDALGHVNRLLVLVEVSGKDVPPAGTSIVAQDKEVGRITSAAWSPERSAPLGLALVRRTHASPGTSLMVEGVNAQVVERRKS